jgi:hypothetical protein
VAIPSPSSRRPEKRAERDGSSGTLFRRLTRPGTSARLTGRTTAMPDEPGQGSSSIPEPEYPAGGAASEPGEWVRVGRWENWWTLARGGGDGGAHAAGGHLGR